MLNALLAQAARGKQHCPREHHSSVRFRVDLALHSGAATALHAAQSRLASKTCFGKTPATRRISLRLGHRVSTLPGAASSAPPAPRQTDQPGKPWARRRNPCAARGLILGTAPSSSIDRAHNSGSPPLHWPRHLGATHNNIMTVKPISYNCQRGLRTGAFRACAPSEIHDFKNRRSPSVSPVT